METEIDLVIMKLCKYYLSKPTKMIKKQIKVFVHSLGAKYYCPVCANRINHFYPLPDFYFINAQKNGYPYKLEQAETLNYQNYSCPLCGASDRDRLYALYLKGYLASREMNEIIKIIDIAPSAPLSHFINNQIAYSKNISYRTADMEMNGVDDKIDISNMQLYSRHQFDFFICSHVLEHVPDDNKAFSELYRILKPGGSGILMVPIILGLSQIDEDPSLTDESEKWRRFGQNDHIRLYSKEGFIDRAGKAGFLIHQYGKEYFGEKALTRSGITDQSVLYVVEKNYV